VSSKLGGAVDRASDLGTLWIIHGHGTGSLKQEVLSLLKQEPLVERWEDAPQKEGGSGCTLAYLK
jgi:DNA mismatch repair protein MutS2